ncbi:hypothetical protein P4O66_004854, partial [Electrophorus voltai]
CVILITDGEEKTYGSCEGPDAVYVKLISSDGHESIVKREHAITSGTIKAMLSGPERERERERMFGLQVSLQKIKQMREIFGRFLPMFPQVCMYFTYNVCYTNSSTEIPEFPITPEIALELLMAANFLDC